MVDTPVNRPSIQDGSVVQSGFFSNILTPGSSLNPTFLLALDIAFGLLLCVFLVLLVLTRGSVHIIVLIGIEACLWTSVKWYVLISPCPES